jgi:hypothetical protein
MEKEEITGIFYSSFRGSLPIVEEETDFEPGAASLPFSSYPTLRSSAPARIT